MNQRVSVRRIDVPEGKSLDQHIMDLHPGCEILHKSGRWEYPKSGETYVVKVRRAQGKRKR